MKTSWKERGTCSGIAFMVALALGMGTVTAETNDGFVTEVESTPRSTIFNQIGTEAPKTVKATGNTNVSTSNSVTTEGVAKTVSNVVNVGATQAKSEINALKSKVAALESGSSTSVTTNKTLGHGMFPTEKYCLRHRSNGVCDLYGQNQYRQCYRIYTYVDGKLATTTYEPSTSWAKGRTNGTFSSTVIYDNKVGTQFTACG